jgi:two-component system cell cycle response regulator DivK
MAGERVLIVDDNAANLKLLNIVMSDEGYDVRTAVDAEEALCVLEDFEPRLILMDVQLPGMDGLELTRRLKASGRARDIVILALTAYAMKGDEARMLDAGCDGYMSKPIDVEALPIVAAAHIARGCRGH